MDCYLLRFAEALVSGGSHRICSIIYTAHSSLSVWPVGSKEKLPETKIFWNFESLYMGNRIKMFPYSFASYKSQLALLPEAYSLNHS